MRDVADSVPFCSPLSLSSGSYVSLRVRGFVEETSSFFFPSSHEIFLFTYLFVPQLCSLVYLFAICLPVHFSCFFSLFLSFTRVFLGTRENSLLRICGTRSRMDPFFFPEIEDDSSEGCNLLLLLLLLLFLPSRPGFPGAPRVARAASERISLFLSARYRILNSPE